MKASTAPASFRPSVVIVGLLMFVVISCAIAFVVSEAALRVYLEHRNPANFQQPPNSSTFLFFRDSPWSFDAQVGYVYKRDHVWLGGFVQDGRFMGCDSRSKTDALGNMGASGLGYADADIKILVFGDSVTAQPADNVTYPLLLERALSERLGRRVSVMNFGRDGYGVLQMIDLAVVEVPRWKPDLVLINFITDDLDRDRFWRTEMTIDGRARVFVTTIADPTPPPSQRVDAMLLAPEASQEWCNQLRRQPDQSSDPILRGLMNAYASKVKEMSVKPTLWDLDYSVVAETVLHGDPFAFVLRRIPPTTNPRIRRDRYEDARFVQGLKTLHSLGVPISFIHLPIYDELKQGQYLPSPHKAALLNDLERLIGRAPLKNLSEIRVAPEDVDRFPVNQYDKAHPSPFGMQVYATSLTEMLVRSGALEKLNGPAAAPTSPSHSAGQ